MDSDTETIISYNSDDDNDTIIENATQTTQTTRTTQPIRNHYLYHLRQGNIRSNEIADIIERIAANVFQQNQNQQNQYEDSENSYDSHDTDDDDIHRNDNTNNDTDTDTDTDNNDILDDNESIS